MRMQRAIGWLLLPALFVVACTSTPREPAGSTPTAPAPPVSAEQPARSPEPQPSVDQPSPDKPQASLAARFHLYTGPLGFKFPDAMQELGPGASVVIGLDPFDLDVVLPGTGEQALRQALTVKGTELLGEPTWLEPGGLALQIEQGQAGQVVTVRLELAGRPPATLTIRRAAPAVVTMDQRFGHSWKPVTVLDAYTTPGPSAVRLSFSKPVRMPEVEQALLAAQSGPIRGLMEWIDEQTLTWQIAELPPRLDFLLGGAHDADGLPLPGGIPSLRLGEPPILVEVDLSDPVDAVRGTLPPDIIRAGLTRDARVVNLLAWTPGTTKWDWQTIDVYYDLEAKTLKRGRQEEALPRLPADLENWVISPNGLLVAGLRSKGSPTESYQADLVVVDMRGGRSQTFPGVIGRFRGAHQLDLTTHLTWSPDSLQVAALSYAGDSQSSELIVIEPASGNPAVLVSNLPVRSDGTRLAWSPDGKWLLAGNLLVNQESKAFVSLQGPAHQAIGLWEPDGSRLLYSAQDWGLVTIIDPDKGEATPLGDGLIVGWTGPGRVLVIRWPGSATRYLPPGQ